MIFAVIGSDHEKGKIVVSESDTESQNFFNNPKFRKEQLFANQIFSFFQKFSRNC